MVVFGREGVPVEGVVPHLGRVVEDRRLVRLSRDRTHDLHERLFGELRPRDGLVQVVDVGAVVLSVVKGNGVRGDGGGEGVVFKWEFGQFDGHGFPWGGRRGLGAGVRGERGQGGGAGGGEKGAASFIHELEILGQAARFDHNLAQGFRTKSQGPRTARDTITISSSRTAIAA